MKIKLLFFLLSILSVSNSFKLPFNPCPSIFKYIYERHSWFGHITVPAPPKSANVAVISTNFSIEGSVPNGKIVLDEYDKAIDKIRNGENLKFVVTFPKSKFLPHVTQIQYNDRTICSGTPVSAQYVTNFWLQYTYNWTGVFTPHYTDFHYPIDPHDNDFNYQPPPTKIPYSPSTFTYEPDPPIFTNPVPQKPTTIPKKYKNYRECGSIRSKRYTENEDDDYAKRIINGSFVPRNAHPWLTALYDVSKGRAEFFCAGNLISKKHVLTAAHCTVVKVHKNIQVRLGVHNTNNLFDPGSQTSMVVKAMEHPEYRKGFAHADIAFLILDKDIEFTQAIKPICLWNYNADFQAIIGYVGTIMGWGINENGETSTLPMKTDVTITTHAKCKEVELLKDLITDETFCAGTRGSGPCMGDSGGGLFMIMDGKWYLRGIISTSLADRYTEICNVDTYSVYVDTAKYMNWVVNNMEYN